MIGLPNILKASTLFVSSYPQIGEVVVACVEDFTGTIHEPLVEFSVDYKGNKLKAYMPTKSLSPTEKLALQSGTIMQLYVTNSDENTLQVSLKENSKPVIIPRSVSNSSINNKNVRKINNNKSNEMPPVSSLLLNNLKTGTKLSGYVASSTPYAAFINVDVVRKGKGVQSNGGILEKGTKLVVFVKEVWKNSGRFTLTTDPDINKGKILEVKKKNKEDGIERRKSRRLRRQLEKITIGKLVSGVVQRVQSDRITVSISSLGSINITGFIYRDTLPKQFSIPGDLKDSFQIQLLKQDFQVGRKIECSISKINRVSNDNSYTLDLEYEQFLSDIDDSNIEKAIQNVSVIKDSEIKEIDNIGEDDDIEDDDLEDLNESIISNDIKELFDELRGNQPLLAVKDIYDWEDVIDMIEDGTIKRSDIDAAVDSVDSNVDGFVNLQQFSSIIEYVQDIIDPSDSDDLDDDNDDLIDEKFDLPAASDVVTMTNDDSNSDINDESSIDSLTEDLFNELSHSKAYITIKEFIEWEDIQELIDSKLISADEIQKIIKKLGIKDKISLKEFQALLEIIDNKAGETEDNLVLSRDENKVVKEVINENKSDDNKPENISDEIIDDLTDEDIKELFDEIRDNKSTISKKQFLSSDFIEEGLDDELFDLKAIGDIVTSVINNKSTINYEEFSKIIRQVFDLINDDESDVDDDSEQDSEDLLKELYEDIKGTKSNVSKKDLLSSEIIQETLSEGSMDKEAINSIITSVIKNKSTINYEEFKQIINQIDNSVEDIENDEFIESEELSDDDIKEYYNEIRGDKSSITRDDLLSWDVIQDVINDKFFTTESINEIVTSIILNKKSINFNEFSQIIRKIFDSNINDDSIENKIVDDDINDDNDIDESDDEKIEDDLDEISEEELKQERLEVFNELKGSKKFLDVSMILNWSELSEFFESGLLTEKHVRDILKQLKITTKKQESSITFDQFQQILDLLEKEIPDENFDDVIETDELEENDNKPILTTSKLSDKKSEKLEEAINDEERISLFNDLKGKENHLTVKTFKKWEDVQDMLDNKYIDVRTLNKIIKENNDNKNTITYEQFNQILDDLDSYLDTSTTEDSESNSDNEFISDEETSDVYIEEEDFDLEIFNELRGKNNLLPIKALLTWDEIQNAIDDKVLTNKIIDDVLKSMKLNRNDKIDFKQFQNIINELDEFMSGEDDVDDEEDDGENIEYSINEDELKSIYNKLKGKAAKLSVNGLLKWDFIIDQLTEGKLTDKTLNSLINELKDKNNFISFDNFNQLYGIISNISVSSKPNKAVEATNNHIVSKKIDKKTEEEDEDDFDKLSKEEVINIQKDVFNELKSKKSNKVTMKNLLSWESIQEGISANDITKEEVIETVGLVVGNRNPDGLTFDQFCDVLNILDGTLDEKDFIGKSKQINLVTPSTVKGFGKTTTTKVDDNEDDGSEMTKELFDELRGKKATVSVDKFKDLKDTKKLLESGAIKFSTLEKAIAKVGSYESGEMNYEQFNKLLEIIQNNVDYTTINEKDYISEDDDDSEDVVTDDEDDEEDAKVIFNNLKSNESSKLKLFDFINWEDLQELLDSNALTANDLASAIQEVVGKDDENAELTFDEFYKLLSTIENYIKSDEVTDESIEVKNENDSEESDLSDITDNEDEDEEEITEIFNDLAKGKEFISLKALKKWDDLKELIDTGKYFINV
eukprot:gene16835-22320_t